jgi:hypothetical protein
MLGAWICCPYNLRDLQSISFGREKSLQKINTLIGLVLAFDTILTSLQGLWSIRRVAGRCSGNEGQIETKSGKHAKKKKKKALCSETKGKVIIKIIQLLFLRSPLNHRLGLAPYCRDPSWPSTTLSIFPTNQEPLDWFPFIILVPLHHRHSTSSIHPPPLSNWNQTHHHEHLQNPRLDEIITPISSSSSAMQTTDTSSIRHFYCSIRLPKLEGRNGWSCRSIQTINSLRRSILSCFFFLLLFF